MILSCRLGYGYFTHLMLWISLIAFCGAILAYSLGDEERVPEKGHKAKMLTRKEAAIIRRNVYTRGRSTATPNTGPWAFKRILIVPEAVTQVYKMKRIATLRLLLDIVKGGAPKDSVLAAAYAIALEDNPCTASLYAYYDLELVDDAPDKDGSGRDEFIEIVSKLLSEAEKKQ